MLNHRYADLNGIRLHYVIAGEGPLMLFLHGFPEFWYAWKDQLEEFQRDFTLVAHDWGGAAAWVFAIAYPEMLERLIIINAPHPFVFQRELRQNPAQQKASQYMLMFQSPKAEQIVSANNYAHLREDWGLYKVLSDSDMELYYQAWSQPGALTGGLNYYRASRLIPPTENAGQNDISDRFSQPLQVPTLVIWGEQDPALLTGNLNGLDQYVTNLTIQRVPDGSHWVIHEQPTRINELIRGYTGYWQ